MDTNQIKKEARHDYKFFILGKVFPGLMLLLAIAFVICVFTDSRSIRLYTIIGSILIFFVGIIFSFFSPWLISTNVQLRKYLADAIEKGEALKKIKNICYEKKKDILSRGPFTIDPYPEIAENWRNVLRNLETIKDHVEKNYSVGFKDLNKLYNDLYFKYLSVGQEVDFRNQINIKKTELLDKKGEILKRITDLTDQAKKEKDTLPLKAINHRLDLANGYQKQIDGYDADIKENEIIIGQIRDLLNDYKI